MNKNELIDALAPRLGGRAAAALAVESVVDAVLRQVAAGGSVAITGFGTFEPVDRAPRTGRNPHTGDPVPIPAARVPRFRPGGYFRTVVADPRALPEEGLAGARVGSSDDDAPDEGGAAPEQPSPAAGGPGVPPSIRRSPGARQGAPGTGRSARKSAARRSAARTGHARPGGAPATVRADPLRPAPAPSAEPVREPAPGDRLTIGGEQITRDMISAKKAQLARAQSDDGAERAAAGDRPATAGSGTPQGQGKGGKKSGKGGGKKTDKSGTKSGKGGKKNKKGAKKDKDKGGRADAPARAKGSDGS